jgi:hypothetical protein
MTAGPRTPSSMTAYGNPSKPPMTLRNYLATSGDSCRPLAHRGWLRRRHPPIELRPRKPGATQPPSPGRLADVREGPPPGTLVPTPFPPCGSGRHHQRRFGFLEPFGGAPGRTRTCDPRLRREGFYQSGTPAPQRNCLQIGTSPSDTSGRRRPRVDAICSYLVPSHDRRDLGRQGDDRRVPRDERHNHYLAR